MSAPNSSVSVFHFTSRISNAKIRKYKLATERGMGPSSGNGTVAAMANGRSDSEQPAGSPTPPTPATESPPAQPPPSKKPRLKLNVREKSNQSNQDAGDTIRVSTRPKRKPSTFRYSGEMIMNEQEEPPAKKSKTKAKPSPAPSSGLSSLESAPQSEREESPFIDPPSAPVSADYGDFMSYYVTGGDDEDAAQKKAKAKPKRQSRGKATSKVESETPKAKEPTPAKPAEKPAEKPQQPPAQAQQPPPGPPPQQQAPAPQHAQPPLPPPQQQRPPPPPPHQQRPGPPHNLPPPFPPGPPMHRGPPLPPPPPRLPQPIINFIDIVPEPRTTTGQDSVVDMVRKLEELSSALTNFGGVPAIPPTPPQEKAKPVPKAAPPPPPPKPAPKPPAEAANEVDFLLSHFNDDDDDDDSSNGNANDTATDSVHRYPGRLDGPLTYGIEFIQNALKSWAQQRMTHQVTQQWQAQQQHQLHQQQLQAQRRGPGRPRRYDEPNLLNGPPPIIHMDLAQTPEGVAIKNFQRILDSGCLLVNGIIPFELSRALRHLYMQIDHLINQGSKSNDNWVCMSYQAQIKSHKLRVDKWKEQQKKAQEEMERQRQIANEQVMAQMGLQPHQMLPQTAEQAQKAHALELERRRSMQHAAQQPYISQQHLNPLPLGPNSATPTANGPSPPPSREGGKQAQSAPATATSPGSAPPPTSAGSPPQAKDTSRAQSADADPNDPNGKGSQVQLDKMKLYMPGFLPRSGQSMKFSFAPHSDAALQAFGADSFPADEPGSSLPNRGPMSAPPAPATGDVSNGPDAPSKPRPGDAASPIQIDSDTPAEQALASDEAQAKPASKQDVQTPEVGTGGFKAINAPANRPSSVPADSPDTIRVTMRHPSGSQSATASPALGNGVGVSKTTGVPRVTNFPA